MRSTCPHRPECVSDLMSELELCYHKLTEEESALISIGMAHAQFELIHPFLGGNGRTGRILIPHLLSSHGILQVLLLYLSLFFKNQRNRYCEHLQRIRTDGDRERWLQFYPTGMRETTNSAIETIRRLTDLYRSDKSRVRQNFPNGVTAEMFLKVFQG